MKPDQISRLYESMLPLRTIGACGGRAPQPGRMEVALKRKGKDWIGEVYSSKIGGAATLEASKKGTLKEILKWAENYPSAQLTTETLEGKDLRELQAEGFIPEKRINERKEEMDDPLREAKLRGRAFVAQGLIENLDKHRVHVSEYSHGQPGAGLGPSKSWKDEKPSKYWDDYEKSGRGKAAVEEFEKMMAARKAKEKEESKETVTEYGHSGELAPGAGPSKSWKDEKPSKYWDDYEKSGKGKAAVEDFEKMMAARKAKEKAAKEAKETGASGRGL